MLARYLGGIAASLGAAGILSAQTPQPKPAIPVPAAPKAATPTAPPAAVKPAAPAVLPQTAPAAPGTAVAAPQTTASGLLTNGGCGPITCPVPCPEVCDPCPGGVCGPAGKYWFDAGYIYWTAKGQNLPALVTTAPLGNPRTQAGVLGQPGTSVLYGDGKYNNNWRSGFYLNAGLWLDACQKCGLEGNFFFLGNSNQGGTFGCPPGVTSPDIVSRPFTNALTGAGDTQLVCFPDILTGSVGVSNESRVIGGGVNFIKNLCCGPCGRFDLILGYQYFRLEDEVVIREDLTSLPGQTNVPTGTRFLVEDRFKTTNDFHGGNIGFKFERRFGKAYVGVRSSVALGVNRQTYDIGGSTTITTPGGTPQTFNGGLLAQPSNIGHYTKNSFAVMPQIGLKLGYQVGPRTRAYVGYDFMYLSNVARAGDQIDLRVNPTQIPRLNGNTPTGPALPAFEQKTTDFWMQGIRVGVEFRF